jgi:hypothetical protein
MRWSLLALSVSRGAAPFPVAIGGIADIDRPQVLDRSDAIDPTATLAVQCGNGFDAGFSPYQCPRLNRYDVVS